MRSYRDYIMGAGVLCGLIVIVWLIIYAIRYEKVLDIVVEDRWWTYTQKVRYKRWECDVSIDAELGATTDCGYEYYTRCRSSKSGREWAPQPPKLACHVRADDWIDSYITYTAQYRIEDTIETGKVDFAESHWDKFEPSSRGRATIGAFNRLKAFERQ
jgi:hypothetical protein